MQLLTFLHTWRISEDDLLGQSAHSGEDFVHFVLIVDGLFQKVMLLLGYSDTKGFAFPFACPQVVGTVGLGFSATSADVIALDDRTLADRADGSQGVGVFFISSLQGADSGLGCLHSFLIMAKFLSGDLSQYIYWIIRV